MKLATLSNASLDRSTEAFLWKRCLAVIVCFSLWSTLASCEKPVETPDWSGTTTQEQTETVESARDKLDIAGKEQDIEALIQRRSSADKLDIAGKKQVIAALEGDTKPLRFVSYNLRNYLTMPRGKTEKFKPEHEVKALIANIVRAEPDILGVCEIGNQKDLDHLVARLKEAGLDFQHNYLSKGADPYRRQALLSRYPIQRHEVPKYTYKMIGETHEIRRGILDASVKTPKGEIRFLGAHLKSKRPIAIYDQAEIRREEALILREHASVVLSDPARKVLVFGDMNDTKGSSVVRLLRGPNDKKLTAIELFDKQGTKWTQYWALEDIYSRFDYVFVSTSLLPDVDQKGSFILDTPPHDPASDHRALVILIE